MDWEHFSLRHRAPDKAFEAFVSHMFDLWCGREYGDGVQRVYFLDGRGGDGGVEAFARLADGGEVGLQAKWFRDRFDGGRARKVEQSLEKAAARHPKLVRYLVCMPEDLSDAKDTARHQKSGRDYWDELVARAAGRWPHVKLEFWGSQRLEGILATLAGERAAAYWFERFFISRDDLRDSFERCRAAYFKDRYVPAAHCVSRIDRLIRSFLLDAAERERMFRVLARCRAALLDAEREVVRLQSLDVKGATEHGLPTLAANALAEVAAIRGIVDDLLRRVRDGVVGSAGYAPADVATSRVAELSAAIAEIERRALGYSAAHKCGAALEPIAELTGEVAEIILHWSRLEAPLAVVGPPGTGKTQSALAVAEAWIEGGGVAVVVAGRSVDASRPLGEILSAAVDRPGSSAGAVLDALEAATHFANPRPAEDLALAHDTVQPAPPLALIVVDALEESRNARHWGERLTELRGMLRRRPRVRLVVSTRVSTADLAGAGDFRRAFVGDEGDLSIVEVVRAYARLCEMDVEGVPWLPWALRTPYAVRLFAELHRGTSVKAHALIETSIPALLKEKLSRIEQELRSDAQLGWPESERILLRSLRALAEAFVQLDRPLIHDEAVEAMRAGFKDSQLMTRPRADHILTGCVAHGILDRRFERADDPLEADLHAYEPAFNVITDYLLAETIVRDAGDAHASGGAPALKLPRHHADAVALAVTILAANGQYVVREERWRTAVPVDSLNRYQLRSLAHLPPDACAAMADWVGGLLTRSMPDARLVLEELVTWAARIPGHPFGAGFLDGALRPLKVADRDLFWSGPESVEGPGGRPWEGYARWRPDHLEPVAGEAHDGMPLILAWLCTTVIASRRRAVRNRLAHWGAGNLGELALLVAAVATANDPQMVQDVVVAAAGAAMMQRDPLEALAALAVEAHKAFFAPAAAARTFDAPTLHAARVVVERASILGCAIDQNVLRQARPPYPWMREALPPVDVEVLATTKSPHGVFTYDLHQYVAPRSCDGFFDLLPPHDPDERSGSAPEPSREVARAVIEGRLPASSAARDLAADSVERQLRLDAQLARLSERVEAVNEGAPARAGDGHGEPDADPDELDPALAQALEEFEGSRPQRQLSGDAAALVRQYEAELGVSPIEPDRLRDAMIVARIKTFGWTAQAFYGRPASGGPGEVLGADIAIERRYRPATHGSRSVVASFREKYVWCAVDAIAGHLASLLPKVRGYGEERVRSVDDYGELGGGMPEPADTAVAAGALADATGDAANPWVPLGLLPELCIAGGSPVDAAIEWLRRAPVPDVRAWCTCEVGGREHIVLSGWAYCEDPHSLCRNSAWVSAFAVPRDDVGLLARDAKLGLLGRLMSYFDGFACGLRGPTCLSPSLASWAPWLREEEGVIDHWTTGGSGEWSHVAMRALAARVYWDSPGGERQCYLPAPLLRDALRIIDGVGDASSRAYRNREGRVVGWYSARRSESVHDGGHRLLVTDAGLTRDAMAAADLVLGWLVRLYREAPLELLDDAAGREDIRFNANFVVLSQAGSLEAYQVQA